MFHILGPNVARGKTATQGPGTYQNQSPYRAVDGETDYSQIHCSHTTKGNTDNPAWWQVDLGDTYRITGIRIYNRDPRGK